MLPHKGSCNATPPHHCQHQDPAAAQVELHKPTAPSPHTSKASSAAATHTQTRRPGAHQWRRAWQADGNNIKSVCRGADANSPTTKPPDDKLVCGSWPVSTPTKTNTRWHMCTLQPRTVAWSAGPLPATFCCAAHRTRRRLFVQFAAKSMPLAGDNAHAAHAASTRCVAAAAVAAWQAGQTLPPPGTRQEVLGRPQSRQHFHTCVESYTY